MSRMPMKLILTQEVNGLGSPGDVVDVAPGYGRNYLIPRGFAMQWTRGAQKQVEQIRRARQVREIRSLEDAKVVAGQLERLNVRLQRRAGSNGRLFGSVGTADIAAAVREAGGPELDRRKIVVQDSIKSTGTHRVQVRLHPEVSAAINLEIVAG
jgi:large subunit ribosomal protein L9